MLSCQIMGPKIENTTLLFAWSNSKSLELEEVYTLFLPTVKNKPSPDFWKTSEFGYHEEKICFSLPLTKYHPLTDLIRLNVRSS